MVAYLAFSVYRSAATFSCEVGKPRVMRSIHTSPVNVSVPPADSGQRILVYTAEPNSPSDDALKLLATWCATTPRTEHRADAGLREYG